MRIAKIILKTLGWIFTGIIFLVVIVLLAIQTGPMKRKIVTVAENQINKIINAEISIGELNGNFFNHLQLNNVILYSSEKDTIASIDKVYLRYRLLPLIRKNIVVNSVEIDNPYVLFEQMSDSTWNLQHIAKPSEKEKDTTTTEFKMIIDVNQFALNNGNIKINAFNPQIPKQVQNLYINLSGKYATDNQVIRLKEFSLLTIDPDLQLKNLNITATGNKNSISLEELLLQTAQNNISINGEYHYNQIDRSHINLSTTPIILDEFQVFLPPEFHFKPNPELTLQATLENKLLALDMNIKDQGQGAEMQLSSYQLLEYLSDSTLLVNYDLALDLEQVDLKYWLDNPEMNFIIDGLLSAKGEGLDPETLKADLEGNFGNTVLYGNKLNKLDILLNYNQGDAKGNIAGSGAFGFVEITPNIRKILSDNPAYHLSMITKNLNIAPLIGKDTLTSNINLEAKVQGSGFDLNRINAQSEIILHPSEVMNIPIDTLGASIDFIRQNLIIHSLLLNALAARVEASGNYNLKGESDIQLAATIDSINAITELLGIDSVETSLQLDAHVQGTPDDLNGKLTLDVGKTRYQQMFIDSLKAVIDGSLKDSNIFAKGNIDISRFVTGSTQLDSISLIVETDTRDIDLSLSIGSEDIQTDLNGMINLDETISILLSRLDLGYKGYNWRLAEDTASIYIKPEEYEVNNFRLVSTNETDSVQSIYLNGVISRVAEQDFSLDIQNVYISEIAKLFVPDQKINGLINLQLQLSGTAASPKISGDLNMDGTTYQNYKFDTLGALLSFENNEADVLLNIVPQDSGSLSVSGNMPAIIRLDSMQFEVQPKPTDSIGLQLLIKEFPLSIMNLVLPTDKASGMIQSDIRMNGTLSQPNILGNLNIVDGLVEMQTYGINYHNIQTDINFSTDRVTIDTFLIESRKGNMTAKGNVQFASELYKADLQNSELSIKFDRFKPLDHKQYNMELSGNIDLNANADSVRFSGDVTIPETQVYLPALLSLFGNRAAPEIPKPLLVQQLEKDNLQHIADSAQLSVQDTASSGSMPLDFMNNLQGDLRVRIPRNMWIRNDDMRLELSGDVELVKQREYFELFGSIEVVRGQYNLFGKVFVIESGTITFQGGEELNPTLALEAMYTFRDSERNRKELTLNVTGELQSPEIQFTYEGQQISEGDAISYILFGTNMDALTSGQQDNLTSGMDVEGLAQKVASSIISSQLTKFLGNTFNVDYIEFSSSSSFDNASLTVGKYITNRLFVSYQQTIGHIEDDDIARYEMTMEYELFRFLFLQLTSSSITNGADLIFKFNAKTK